MGYRLFSFRFCAARCIVSTRFREFNPHSSTDLVTLALFVLCGLGIAAISHRQGVARREAEAATLEARDRERELRESEDRYRKLIRDANEGMMSVDINDNIGYLNPSLAELLGYDESELVGQPVYTMFFPDDHALARARRVDRKRGIAEQYETRLQRKDGSEVWAVCNVSIIQEDGVYQGTFTMFTDITYRKEAEADLAAAYKREVMLNRIAEAIRQSLDIDDVQRIAVEALGTTLGADRCASITVDTDREKRCGCVHEWRRPDMPKILGEYRTSIFHESLADAFPGGKSLVIDDIEATDISDRTRV